VAGFILPKFLKRQRRDIFVVQNPIATQAPSGATYSDDTAPDGAWEFNGARFYKDFAPTALSSQSGAVTRTAANFVAGFIL
jgi:hypothetical protein